MSGGRPKRIREPGWPASSSARPTASSPSWPVRPPPTRPRSVLPGPSNGATYPAATPADRVVLAEASRLACGSCHSASETFRTLETRPRIRMPEAGRRRGVGRRCGFIWKPGRRHHGSPSSRRLQRWRRGTRSHGPRRCRPAPSDRRRTPRLSRCPLRPDRGLRRPRPPWQPGSPARARPPRGRVARPPRPPRSSAGRNAVCHSGHPEDPLASTLLRNGHGANRRREVSA